MSFFMQRLATEVHKFTLEKFYPYFGRLFSPPTIPIDFLPMILTGGIEYFPPRIGINSDFLKKRNATYNPEIMEVTVAHESFHWLRFCNRPLTKKQLDRVPERDHILEEILCEIAGIIVLEERRGKSAGTIFGDDFSGLDFKSNDPVLDILKKPRTAERNPLSLLGRIAAFDMVRAYPILLDYLGKDYLISQSEDRRVRCL